MRKFNKILGALVLCMSVSLVSNLAQAEKKKGSEWKQARMAACANLAAGDACRYERKNGESKEGVCVEKRQGEGLYCANPDKKKMKKRDRKSY